MPGYSRMRELDETLGLTEMTQDLLQDWPRIKKTRRRDASIVFIDETGFRLQPVNRRSSILL